jgi:hypothetical protein
MGRDRMPTLSDVDEIVGHEIQRERQLTSVTFGWLEARLTVLERKVTLWGIVPTVIVALAALVEYFHRR